jgi:N,N'-diacetyllegionaminate synthase
MSQPYLLAEFANAHGGDLSAVMRLIDRCAYMKPGPSGVKFQPFRAETLALPDFSWFETYTRLGFDASTWTTIICRATAAGMHVWLDLFDAYSAEILTANRSLVTGVKLQSSVLQNEDLLQAVESCGGLSGLTLLINVSGLEIGEIEAALRRLQPLGAAETRLQIGFQRYPTSLSASALQKVSVLRAAFPNLALSFADHAAGDDPFALRLPLLAVALGCDLIEKHVCLDRATAPYDAFSSLVPEELSALAIDLEKTVSCFDGPFVSQAERDYLREGQVLPVTGQTMRAGDLVNASNVQFRRTAQAGVRWADLLRLQSEMCVLGAPKPTGRTFRAADFRAARVGVIVACRLKSSRLEQKALLPIRGVPSVDRCLENCVRFAGVDVLVLATSELPEDAPLASHTLGGRVQVWRGDPEDVIRRYLGACDAYGIDTIIRVTADCPVVSPEIAVILLEEHFRHGADFTAARRMAVGSAAEIYNTNALRRVIEYLGRAAHSEYMSWYMRNNADLFRVNEIDLPPDLVRDYRLTLDYQADLDMFERLYAELDAAGRPPLLRDVFAALDAHPDIPALNESLTLSYKTDRELIDMLNRSTRIDPRNSTTKE